MTYHRILPADDPRARIEEPGMTVTPATLRRHVTWLREFFEIVSLSDWIRRETRGGTLPRRACAITLDDGWQDNYEFAFPVLADLDVPATIFAVSDLIGTTGQFWPNRVSRLLAHAGSKGDGHAALAWLRDLGFESGDGAPRRDDFARAIALCKKIPRDDLLRLLDESEDAAQMPVPEKASLLSWDELRTMTHSGLVEVGSHTCTHVRLGSQTPEDVMVREISESRTTLERMLGIEVSMFCYPNGDMSERSEELVKDCYEAAVTTRMGINTPATNHYELKRVGVHEDIASTRRDFLARLSSWI